jgi:hypothetical protein
MLVPAAVVGGRSAEARLCLVVLGAEISKFSLIAPYYKERHAEPHYFFMQMRLLYLIQYIKCRRFYSEEKIGV